MRNVKNKKELLFNQSLDQATKLIMVKMAEIFHEDLREHFGVKGYKIFKSIMTFLHEDELEK